MREYDSFFWLLLYAHSVKKKIHMKLKGLVLGYDYFVYYDTQEIL